MPISFLFFLIFRNSIARIPYRLPVPLLGSMHPEDAWRDRFCVSVLPERVWRKFLFRVISRAFDYTGIGSLPEEQGLQCLETPGSWKLARVSLCHGRAIGASCRHPSCQAPREMVRLDRSSSN
jgi:hypothetical protein